MSKVPFRRFITTFLLFNKDVQFIIDKLFSFGYYVTDKEIENHFSDLKQTLPPKYSEILVKRLIFDVDDPGHVEWLNQLGVFEYYNFILKNGKIKDEPEYFKWCRDCLWIHGYKDIMVLVNILLFNEDDPEEISKVIMFKYKKKISVKAIDLYKKVFWDTKTLTAKEALYYCIPFKKSTLILKKLRSGDIEITANDNSEQNDGSDVPFTFHDSSYIKWKIGYRDIPVPTCSDFMKMVKQDSYFKYQEAMNMTHSLEVEEENGENDKIGSFFSTKTKKRNVEEQRVRLVKGWHEMFVKSDAAIPKERSGSDKGFFEKMEQLELGFDEEEKIVRAEDVKGLINDVKSDM